MPLGVNLKYTRTVLSFVHVAAAVSVFFFKRSLQTMGFLSPVYIDFLKLGTKSCACYPFHVNKKVSILSHSAKVCGYMAMLLVGRRGERNVRILPFTF